MASESKSALSDLPPDSFWVSKDDEQDWYDRNAVMQRKASLKIGYNRNFNSSFSHPSEKISSNAKSARISVFTVPKARKTSVFDGSPAEKKSGGRFLFRSRSEPGGKPIVHVTEPGSPRVSCTGQVKLKTSDGKKTGFSRLFSSLFRAGSGKSASGRRGNGAVS